MQATGSKADPGPGDADDIAKLLRALNDDLDRNERQNQSDSEDGEDEATGEESRFPFAKIALALAAAGAIGFGIVMLDSDGETSPEVMSVGVTTAATDAASGPVTTIVGAQQQAQIRPPAPPALPPPSSPAAAPTQALSPAPSGALQTETRPITELMLRGPEPPPAALNAPAATMPALRVPEPPAPHLSPVPNATATVPRPDAEMESAGISDEDAAAPPAEPAQTTAPVPPAAAQLQTMLSPAASSTQAAPSDEVDSEMAGEPEDAEPPPATTALVAPPPPSAPAAAPRQPPVNRAPAPRAAPPADGPRAPVATGGRFVVQVGTFKVRENAIGLAARLKSSGYQASTVDWTDQSGARWHAVRVGGYPSEGAARQAADQVRRRFDLPVVVIRR